MDYGKWKYAQKKKDRKSQSHRHETELKEVRIRTPKIGAHDLEIKIQHARGFLMRGDRVQFTMWFRGREMAHQELGRNMLNSVKVAVADIAKVERDMGMEGRSLTMVLLPTVKGTPKAKASALGTPAKEPSGPKAAAKGKPARKSDEASADPVKAGAPKAEASALGTPEAPAASPREAPGPEVPNDPQPPAAPA